MRYIKDFHDGERIQGIYLCRQKSEGIARNGKPYGNVTLQDKTGSIECKIWDLSNAGIAEFEALDYVEVTGDPSVYNNALQLKILKVRVAEEGEYDPADYIPVSSKNIEEMYGELLRFVNSVKNEYLKKLLSAFFIEDEDFIKKFKKTSAAKSVHHGFLGGLLEHTLSVTETCNFIAKKYPIIKRDLLITAAICHDIGKIREFSPFPENDYTDEGNLLGHIVMGSEMIGEAVKNINGFPLSLENELKHCIVAHHGKLEFGSPKKPALIEAMALNYADDLDAKMETFKEALESAAGPGWAGFNKMLDSNIRSTRGEEF